MTSRRVDDRVAVAGHLYWRVTYDLPGAPGESDIQLPCDDCGRGAFWVSGIPGNDYDYDEYPERELIRGDDGSLARLLQDPAFEGVSGQAHTYMTIAAAPGCFYQVGSSIGRDHVVALLDSLRFVDMTA